MKRYVITGNSDKVENLLTMKDSQSQSNSKATLDGIERQKADEIKPKTPLQGMSPFTKHLLKTMN